MLWRASTSQLLLFHNEVFMYKMIILYEVCPQSFFLLSIVCYGFLPIMKNWSWNRTIHWLQQIGIPWLFEKPNRHTLRRDYPLASTGLCSTALCIDDQEEFDFHVISWCELQQKYSDVQPWRELMSVPSLEIVVVSCRLNPRSWKGLDKIHEIASSDFLFYFIFITLCDNVYIIPYMCVNLFNITSMQKFWRLIWFCRTLHILLRTGDSIM